jgi:hypothetical protein
MGLHTSAIRLLSYFAHSSLKYVDEGLARNPAAVASCETSCRAVAKDAPRHLTLRSWIGPSICQSAQCRWTRIRAEGPSTCPRCACHVRPFVCGVLPACPCGRKVRTAVLCLSARPCTRKIAVRRPQEPGGRFAVRQRIQRVGGTGRCVYEGRQKAQARAFVLRDGKVAEWFKATVLKTVVGASPPWVRIPPFPPIKVI